MERIFIKRSEIMRLTGWRKTKTAQICLLIQTLYDYPPQRKDVLVKDFCNYLDLLELDVQKSLKAL